MKIAQIITSEIANSILNGGRPFTEVAFNADLAQSIFQTNKTASEMLTVVPVKADERDQFINKTQALLDNLDLGDKGVRTVVESLPVEDDEEDKTKHWKVAQDLLTIPVDSKIKYRVVAGHHRLLHFWIKLLITGVNEELYCKVLDSKDESELAMSEAENLVKNTGVTKITDLDIYGICYNMIKAGRVHREVDFRKATGLKRTRAQKSFGLALKGTMYPEFHAEIVEGRVQVGESFCTITELPNGIGSTIGKCRDMAEIRQKLEEKVTLKTGEKTKAIGSGDIKDILLGRASGPIHDLLTAIVEGRRDDAVEACVIASAAFTS